MTWKGHDQHAYQLLGRLHVNTSEDEFDLWSDKTFNSTMLTKWTKNFKPGFIE